MIAMVKLHYALGPQPADKELDISNMMLSISTYKCHDLSVPADVSSNFHKLPDMVR